MDTSQMKEEAGALLQQAEAALADGKVEEFEKIIGDAQGKMEKAESIEAADGRLKALQGDFSRPTNNVPVTSNDVAVYNADDTTARTKADYRPASWVKGLPASSQPIWVQEQMGENQKEQARFQKDTFVKWLKSPSENVFFKNASLDEVKAMQEDKIVSHTSVTM